MSLTEKRWSDAGLNGEDVKDVAEIASSFTADQPAALYQLPSGNFCLFVATPGTNGYGYYESPVRDNVEDGARAMGVDVRLGIAPKTVKVVA